MFPALAFLTRSVTKDMQIGNILERSSNWIVILYPILIFTGKYTIPSGVELVLGVMSMHRSKDNFNLDSNVFNPDNFLP